MKTITNGIGKFFISNFAVVVAIILLPVFLVTDKVAVFDQMLGYLFNES